MAEAKSYQGLAAALIGGRYIDFGTAVTTAPTTGLEKGYVFLAWSDSLPMLGVCYSTAAQGIKYIPFTTKTFGRATA